VKEVTAASMVCHDSRVTRPIHTIPARTAEHCVLLTI